MNGLRVFVLGMFLMSCNKAEFKANDRMAATKSNENKIFEIPCGDGQSAALTVDYSATKTTSISARVRGQFCPVVEEVSTILFIIDFSGSMGRHIPEQGAKEVSGNDPQVNGSCGRLKAANAIYEKIKQEKMFAANISIGMIPFAGEVLANEEIPFKGYEEFSGEISPELFCKYIVQDESFGYDPGNPGGMASSEADSSTNYRAAFAEAYQRLQGLSGNKVIYFISDGEPTSGGTDPAESGIEAGFMLRENIDNLTLNALLLGEIGPGAEEVLNKVAGSSDRVRRVANADDLAKEIVKFPEIDIGKDQVKATYRQLPNEPIALDLIKFDKSGDKKWEFETADFSLVTGDTNALSQYEVVIEALTNTNEKISSSLTINFKSQ